MKIANSYNILDEALQNLSLISGVIGLSIYLLIIELAYAYLISKDFSFKLAKVFGENFNDKLNYYFKKLVELNKINCKFWIIVLLVLLVSQVTILMLEVNLLVDNLEGYVKSWLKARMITKLCNTLSCNQNLIDTSNYGLLDEALENLGLLGWLMGFTLFLLIIEVGFAYLIPKDFEFKLAKVFGEDFNNKVNYYFKKLINRSWSRISIVVLLSVLTCLSIILIYDVSLLVDNIELYIKLWLKK